MHDTSSGTITILTCVFGVTQGTLKLWNFRDRDDHDQIDQDKRIRIMKHILYRFMIAEVRGVWALSKDM